MKRASPYGPRKFRRSSKSNRILSDEGAGIGSEAIMRQNNGHDVATITHDNYLELKVHLVAKLSILLANINCEWLRRS